jgi:Domain of unknown function (DUF6456)
MENPKKSAEPLGPVKINNGQNAATLTRECDPNGAIVVHAVRKSSYVHERLLAAGKLDPVLFDAAEKFRSDFERAQLVGNYARMDLFKTRAGKQDMTDKVAAAKGRIAKALEALGPGRDGPSFSQSCIWNAVGLGMTMEDWTQLIRQNGAAMNADKAAGILHVCLERLALHYGLVDMGKLASIGNDKAFGRGVRAALEFIDVFNASAKPTEKLGMARLMKDLQKRFGKFA